MADRPSELGLGQRRNAQPGSRGTPGEDWRSPLPEEIERLYQSVVRELSTAYDMAGITLDEAIEARLDGRLVAAREQARFAAELLQRVQERLLHTLAQLGRFGGLWFRDAAALPEVNPVMSIYFRGAEARRVAKWHAGLHWLLIASWPQFANKVRALKRLVRGLTGNFRESALDIADGTCVSPLESWEELEVLHHDFNTCLQEVIILLKSVFLVLPPAEARTLWQRLQAPPAAPPAVAARIYLHHL
jgi:hypothetical protein